MSVLLAGATGYIGSGVLGALVEAGYDVTALVRAQAKADALTVRGARAVVGDMADRDLVSTLAADAEAVITAASPGDDSSARVEEAFTEAALEALPDGATFIRTGGVWVHGAGADLTEATPLDPPALVAWRPGVDERALKETRVRAMVVEPGVVYGQGQGIPSVVASSPQVETPEGTALTLVGPGDQHWTTIHVDDLAQLYVAVLRHGSAGERYLAVSGENPTVREIGEALSRRVGLAGRVVPEAPSRTVARLGAFGEALLIDQQATGAHARSALGWAPRRRSLLEEIAAGGYDVAR